jgi:hypothetical protein
MIVIDGVTYNIPYKTVRRKADLLYKFAERTQNGQLHSELIGVYFNYSLEFGMSANNVSAYAALWLKLTQPVTSHTVTLPDESGGLTFTAYFANIRDEVTREKATTYFRNLTVDVIAISPERTP